MWIGFNARKVCACDAIMYMHVAWWCSRGVLKLYSTTVPTFEQVYTTLFQILATSSWRCNSFNHVSQSESRIQTLLQFDWLARFSFLQPDVARTGNNTVKWRCYGAMLLKWCKFMAQHRPSMYIPTPNQAPPVTIFMVQRTLGPKVSYEYCYVMNTVLVAHEYTTKPTSERYRRLV